MRFTVHCETCATFVAISPNRDDAYEVAARHKNMRKPSAKHQCVVSAKLDSPLEGLLL